MSHATEGVVWNSYFDLVPSRALTIVKHCRVDSMCLRHKALYCGRARRFICGSCRIGPLQHGCEHLVTFSAQCRRSRSSGTNTTLLFIEGPLPEGC